MEKIGVAVTSYVRAQVDELKQPCDFSCGMRMATSMTLGMAGGVGEVGEAAGAGGLRAELNNVVRPQSGNLKQQVMRKRTPRRILLGWQTANLRSDPMGSQRNFLMTFR
jgi:hypothetical protein